MSQETRLKQMKLIADATFQLIKNEGIEKTTVRKIAKQAGLSLGTVQYYFPKQHDIYSYSMDLLSKKIMERTEQVVLKEDGLLEEVVELLKQFIVNGKESNLIENEVWLSFSLMALRDQELKMVSLHKHQLTKKMMEHIIKTLRQNNVLSEGLELDKEAENLHIFIDGLTVHSVLYPDLLNEESIDKKLKNYLQNILQK